jgi:hypothetical protein
LDTLQPGAIQPDNPTQKRQDRATARAKAIATYAEKPPISPQELINLLSGQLQKKTKLEDAALQCLYQGYALADNWVNSIWSLCILTSLSSQGDLLTKFTQGLEFYDKIIDNSQKFDHSEHSDLQCLVYRDKVFYICLLGAHIY